MDDSITLSLKDGMDAMVEKIIRRAIDSCGGNITQAARLLGITRKTIYNRLRYNKTPEERYALRLRSRSQIVSEK